MNRGTAMQRTAAAMVTALGATAFGQWTTSGPNTYIQSAAAHVGIGLNNPLYPLQIRTANFTYGAYIQNSLDASTAIFGYGSAVGGDVRGVWGYSEAPFGTGVVGQAVADTGQAVGVRGLSNADNGFGGYFSGKRFGIYSEVTGTGYAAFLEGTTYVSANLGIGTTNPTAKLEIVAGADNNGTTDRQMIALAYRTGGFRHWIRSRHNSAANDQGNAIDFFLNNSTAVGGSSQAGTGNVQVMTINAASGGRVGIGNSNPTSTLEVTGGIRARGGLPGASGVSNNGFSFNGNSGDNDSGMFSIADGTIVFCTDSVEAARFIPGGNMGIGFTPAPSNKLAVNGNIFGTSASSGVKSFKIDHPLDPENKYLMHSCIESPDMMNIYNGNAVTDARGYATVTLPTYFEALNMDFRYQLTVVDDNDDASWVMVKVAREVADNEFVIRSSSPNVKVSWQVTGIRKDPLAVKMRIQPETVKEPEARGKYLFPAAYDLPDDRGIMQVPSRPKADAAPGASQE